MCMIPGGGGGSAAAPVAAPPPPPLPPPAAPPPTQADPAVAAAKVKNKQTSAVMQGRDATILTTPLGDLSPVNTTLKTALGA